MKAQDFLHNYAELLLSKLPAKERKAKEAHWRAVETRAGNAFTNRPLPDAKTLREIQASGDFSPAFALSLERMLEHGDCRKAENRQL